MAKLEDLTNGSVVHGLLSGEPVTVVSTKWYGSSSVEVIFKTNHGTTGSQILYREDEPSLNVLEKSLPWSFDVDGNKLRLVSEAYRIHLAHLFDPYLAVHTSAIEPLPHQISAVYEEMLPRLPLRYVLADDPGTGKTIMTGLLLKELIIRGDLKRCLIVSPGNLAEQWQDELFQKFHAPINDSKGCGGVMRVAPIPLYLAYLVERPREQLKDMCLIDSKNNILRKGAVSAQKGEKLIIPINMRDGSLICVGKGNEEWNFTAPHGSGRVMSRSEAKQNISLDEYREAMAGIFSTSISESTLDESPMAYRPIDDILSTIEPTADVTEIITPVYNFKASKAVLDEETMDGKD